MTVLTSNPLMALGTGYLRKPLIIIRLRGLPPYAYERRHIYSFQMTTKTSPIFLQLIVVYYRPLYMILRLERRRDLSSPVASSLYTRRVITGLATFCHVPAESQPC